MSNVKKQSFGCMFLIWLGLGMIAVGALNIYLGQTQDSVSGTITGVGLVAVGLGCFIAERWLASSLKKDAAELERIELEGITAPATVTFADKNYKIKVNNAPVFSIVEFEFRDQHQNVHTARNESVSSEQVIRKNIAVGSQIEIKYLREDPTKTVILGLS